MPKYDAGTYNEVDALIRVGNDEQYIRFSHRREITNRFLGWHYAQLALALERNGHVSEGLQQKYEVKRLNDPDGKHDDCKYFVLDPQHDPMARKALTVYAMAVRRTEPQLAADLDAWLDRLAEPHDD